MGSFNKDLFLIHIHCGSVRGLLYALIQASRLLPSVGSTITLGLRIFLFLFPLLFLGFVFTDLIQ